MSEYEHIKGVIEKIPKLENETVDAYFERATGCKDFERNHYDSIDDLIFDNNLDKKYIGLNSEIYKFLAYKNTGCFDYCDLTKLTEDKYSFSTCFYNGGTCLSEVLEDELKFTFTTGETCHAQ